MAEPEPHGRSFDAMARRLAPTAWRARLTAIAAAALAGPLAALGAALLLLDAPPGLAAALAGGAVLGAAAGVFALRALAAQVETLAESFPPCADHDAVGRIAKGAETLRQRLAVSSRQRDPASLEDPLTGLPNRLAAMRRGRDEITRARRCGDPLSVAAIGFRDESDAPIEIGGLNVALRYAAEALVQGFRAYDVVARWEGEDSKGARFVALLPEAEIEQAVAALERIAQTLEPELERRGYGRGFGMVAGAAVLQPDDATLADIARRAEAALDRARSGFGPAIAAAPGPRTRPANLSSV